MAKKIFTTEEEINEFLRSAQAQLINECSSFKNRKFQTDEDREITLKFKLGDTHDNKKARLLFTAKSWTKMYSLVHKFGSEVEWHGLVERTGECSFIVKDVLIFPHEVSGTTVTSDQKEYEEWLDSLDNDTFNHLRFHGHSHVNMGVTPSSVDMGYRRNILNNFGTPVESSDYFYIFLITNKRSEISAEIYDLQNNALYSKNSTRNEIEIDVLLDDGEYLSEFSDEADDVVTERKYTAPVTTAKPAESTCSTPKYSYGQYGYGSSYKLARKDTKTAVRQSSLFDDDEDDTYYSGIYGGR